VSVVVADIARHGVAPVAARDTIAALAARNRERIAADARAAVAAVAAIRGAA
jgi:hypothetical protein